MGLTRALVTIPPRLCLRCVGSTTIASRVRLAPINTAVRASMIELALMLICCCIGWWSSVMVLAATGLLMGWITVSMAVMILL